MKINFLLPNPKLNGGNRIVMGYASELAKRGHDVVVYAHQRRPLRRVAANMLNRTPSWMPEFSARLVRVPEYHERYIPDADILVTTAYTTMLAAENFPKTRGEHFHFIQHDEGLYHGDPDGVSRAYKLPATTIVVSTWLKEFIKEKYTVDSHLLLNPISHSQFFPVPRIQNSDAIRILMLHHTYEWKGIQEGIAMIRDLQRHHPKLRLVMFGVRSASGEAIDCDEYHHNPHQEKLREIYSSADIFLCPSWDEGFGLPSLEAMACGAALVTYDNGGSRDFAIHEKTALVAPRRQKKRLQEELERLVSDSKLRARLSDAGMSVAKAWPDWPEQTIRLEKVFQDVLSAAVR